MMSDAGNLLMAEIHKTRSHISVVENNLTRAEDEVNKWRNELTSLQTRIIQFEQDLERLGVSYNDRLIYEAERKTGCR
jgi:phage shock protein A